MSGERDRSDGDRERRQATNLPRHLNEQHPVLFLARCAGARAAACVLHRTPESTPLTSRT